jgi:hypothetical protein
MDHRFVIESFWQRGANCVCVAFIKALLLDPALKRSFLVQRKNHITFVFLADDRVLVFTDSEIRYINRQNKIAFRRPREKELKQAITGIRSFVELCFAILVRNLQLKGLDGKEFTQSDAIRALTCEGIDIAHFHVLLGVRRSASLSLSLKKIQQLRKMSAVLLFNKKHIVIASAGWYEDFGKAIPLGPGLPLLLKKPATHFYRLRTKP